LLPTTSHNGTQRGDISKPNLGHATDRMMGGKPAKTAHLAARTEHSRVAPGKGTKFGRESPSGWPGEPIYRMDPVSLWEICVGIITISGHGLRPRFEKPKATLGWLESFR